MNHIEHSTQALRMGHRADLDEVKYEYRKLILLCSKSMKLWLILKPILYLIYRLIITSPELMNRNILLYY